MSSNLNIPTSYLASPLLGSQATNVQCAMRNVQSRNAIRVDGSLTSMHTYFRVYFYPNTPTGRLSSPYPVHVVVPLPVLVGSSALGAP